MKIEVIEVVAQDGTIQETVIIDNEDGQVTSMLKAVWDEQQKAAELGGTLS